MNTLGALIIGLWAFGFNVRINGIKWTWSPSSGAFVKTNVYNRAKIIKRKRSK